MTFRHRVRSRKASRRILKVFALGAVVTGSGLAGAHFVMQADHVGAQVVKKAEAPSAAPAPRVETRYSGLFDPNYTLGFAQRSFEAAAPRGPAFEAAAKVEYVPGPVAEPANKPTPVAEAPAASEPLRACSHRPRLRTARHRMGKCPVSTRLHHHERLTKAPVRCDAPDGPSAPPPR